MHQDLPSKKLSRVGEISSWDRGGYLRYSVDNHCACGISVVLPCGSYAVVIVASEVETPVVAKITVTPSFARLDAPIAYNVFRIL
jgi:hypothetical protein